MKLMTTIFIALMVCLTSVSCAVSEENEVEYKLTEGLSDLTGVNNSWATCKIDYTSQVMWDNINALDTDILRFPGGAISARYNWATGVTSPKWYQEDNFVYRDVFLDGFMQLAIANNKKVVYVLNPRDSVTHILALIETIEANNYPVVAFELGNEAYWGKLGLTFAGYYQWCLDIATLADTDIPFGICIANTCITGQDWKRRTDWNAYLVSRDLSMFDAVIYHYYAKQNDDVEAEFKSCTDYIECTFPDHDTWFTEYNAYRIDQIPGYKDSPEHAAMVRRMMGNILISKIDMACFHSLQGTAFSLFWPSASDPTVIEKGEPYDNLSVIFDVFNIN